MALRAAVGLESSASSDVSRGVKAALTLYRSCPSRGVDGAPICDTLPLSSDIQGPGETDRTGFCVFH